jgi:hypothetical protein
MVVSTGVLAVDIKGSSQQASTQRDRDPAAQLNQPRSNNGPHLALGAPIRLGT